MITRQKKQLNTLANRRELLETSNREKIEFDRNNFRTVSMNSVLSLIYQQANELRGLNEKSGESFSTFSASVPRAGIEPAWK